MPDISVREVLSSAKGWLICGRPDVTFTGISTDTRKIKKGDLFIALKGDNFDGHDFVGTALARGAAGIMIESRIQRLDLKAGDKTIVVQVRDNLKALGDIAGNYRMRFNIPMVGITGSNGKTTAKEMTYAVLSSQLSVLKNEGTENNLIGLPHTLLKLSAGHDIAVLELGTNHFGEIERLAYILKPTMGVITNIGPSHLEFLRSEKGVFKEKFALLRSLGRDGAAIINADDPRLSGIKGLRCRMVRFGTDKGCDFRISRILEQESGIAFCVNDKYEFDMKLFGRHNVYNAMVAITAGFLERLSYEKIRGAVAGFKPVSGRLCPRIFKGIYVIDDTYNANPQSVRAALNVLSGYKAKGKKIFVCGDMLELGRHSYRFHREIGRLAAAAGVEYLISVGAFSRVVRESAVQYGMKKQQVFSCKDNKCAAGVLRNIVERDDVLLLKGSRRMKLEEVINALSSFVSPKGDLVRV